MAYSTDVHLGSDTNNRPVASQPEFAFIVFPSFFGSQNMFWFANKPNIAEPLMDKQITYQEIYDFVADRAEGVPYYAKRLHGGRIQNPTMQAADKDAVFVKY